MHGLVGPNGAGKTTLLGLLLGLAGPTAASWRSSAARCAGRSRCPTGSRGSSTGRVCIPSLTARQNLAALARLRGDGADGIGDALEQVGLTDVADDRVRGFSLGMRQRLGLAAALLTRPRLLVLDEPANGLDPAGTRHVHRVLTGLAAQGTAVVALQPPDGRSGRAVQRGHPPRRPGRVVFSGPVSELAAETDELDYRLRTSDPDAARRVAAETPELRVLPDDDLLRARRRGAPGACRGAGAGRPGRAPGRRGRGRARAGAGRGAARGGLPGPDAVATERRDGTMTAVAVTLPVPARGRRRRAQLPLRADQAAGPVADPSGAPGLLARPGAVRGRHQPAELAAVRHGLRPLDEPDRLGGIAWWS